MQSILLLAFDTYIIIFPEYLIDFHLKKSLLIMISTYK